MKTWLRHPCDGHWRNQVYDLVCDEAKEVFMIFTVTIDRDEDGIWVVECPSIPGCVSQGKQKEEALENIKDAIRLCLEVRGEKGLPLTIETKQVEVAA